MKHTGPTIILALIYLAPSIVGIISNRLDPSLASGLTVAYLAAAGVFFGIIATGVAALLSLKWGVFKPRYLLVGGCLALSVVIFLLANSGALSVGQ
ncbi:MAG: hypothetical protein AAFR82_01055 [Pseudomonadota bacterium]